MISIRLGGRLSGLGHYSFEKVTINLCTPIFSLVKKRAHNAFVTSRSCYGKQIRTCENSAMPSSM